MEYLDSKAGYRHVYITIDGVTKDCLPILEDILALYPLL
jgi:hypothetical protein